jgi:phosphotransferase system enzyme I (PtsI)
MDDEQQQEPSINEPLSEETRIPAVPVSEGIAIGPPYFLSDGPRSIPEFPIKLCEVDAEVERYRKAVFSSRQDLTRLRSDLTEEGSSEAACFIDTHIQMLDDPMITTEMEENIRHMLKNTEAVFRSAIQDYEQRLLARSNPFFEGRLVDVRDVTSRILGYLKEEDGTPSELQGAPEGAILFTTELSPSHAAAASPQKIIGFVSELGGGNSHAALIARSKGIPYVTDVKMASVNKRALARVIVDGIEGQVILNPSEETLFDFSKKQRELEEKALRYATSKVVTTETSDGYGVDLFTNISSLNDLEVFPPFCKGVGLFRTEYLLLPGQRSFPSEEEQYEIYRALVEKCAGRPIVMRVFDLGGDKSPELNMSKEPNPVLGCRGIRFLLKYPLIFYHQLRAIHRAAQGADVRILLPLVSDVGELLTAQKLIEQAALEVGSKPLPVGCMIEVPSAVMSCDVLIRYVDFLSIGTNDLLQYTLGVDRSNPGMSELFYPAHPSVLRMIKMVVTVAKSASKPVALCGEMASNPLFTPLILGLGLRELSCAPRYIPLIKEAICSWTIVEAYRLADEILRIENPREITKLLEQVRRPQY